MYYAHSTAHDDREDWQSMANHAAAVAALAKQYGGAFGGGSCAEAVGWLHDLGKYSDKCQARIAGANIRVDHATAGAVEARRRYGERFGTLLAYAIAGHHAGLANGRMPGRRSPLADRLAADIEPIGEEWQQELTLPDVAPPTLAPRADRPWFQFAFFVRMMFSCLVDADFIDTDAFYARIERREATRGQRPAIGVLRDQLDTHLAAFKSDRPVNVKRTEILNVVRGHAEEPTGHFSLTVPTGGGKTLTSLAFALDHAVAHGLDRVIYVIPFTSIVEQNAQVFRDALGEYGIDAVLEHHGSFDADRNAQLSDASAHTKDKLKRDSENWDAPIIVTTAVQFFESLFAAGTSRCRKLHNIANSVIILDEAQTLPLGLLRPSLAALDELRLNYRSTVVYCTATQPALTDRHEGALPEALADVRELAPDPTHLFSVFRRVSVRHIGERDDDAIVSYLSDNDQVLCIVNNRRHARYLFSRIRDEAGAFHLTTAMHAHHRRSVLAEIRGELMAGRPCRVVATSLIEAGVDVDFPFVLRARAGLDAIAQAAGRCNREARRDADQSPVWVFETTNEDWTPPPELKTYASVMGEVMRTHPEADPLSPAMMQRYFELLYFRQGADALDRRSILGLFNGAGFDGLAFEEVETRYRLIENTQHAVIIPSDDDAYKDAMRTLEYSDRVGKAARTLQQYAVQVPYQGFNALDACGALARVRPDDFGDEFVVLFNEALYDDRSGLNWDDPTFLSAEGLIM